MVGVMDGRRRGTMGRARRILHLDIDAFFASVEQLRNPRLRGRPVVVGSGVIASCSYEARRYGLRAGMSLAEARRRCPPAVVLAGHAPTYRCFAERIFAICGEVAPAVETLLDDAYLDLTGTDRLYPSAAAAGELLRQRARAATGLTVTVGVGTSRVVARLASRAAKPDGLAVVPPGAETEFLGRRPLGDLPGIGPATARLLESMGLETIADLGAIDVRALAKLLGARGRLLAARAAGLDTEPIEPREIPASISRATSFDPPAADPLAIDAMLAYLVERAARTARRQGLAARTVHVDVEPADGRHAGSQERLAAPSGLDRALVASARRLLARLGGRRVALRRIGVSLSGLRPAGGEQLDLLRGPRDEREAALVEGVDRVRDRYGHAALVGGRTLALLDALERDRYGFVLRTPSLTQ